jgi:hypothetical protein
LKVFDPTPEQAKAWAAELVDDMSSIGSRRSVTT